MYKINNELRVGEKVNDWTILSERYHDVKGRLAYRCRCVCGKECEVVRGALLARHRVSCGCLRADTKPYTLWGETKTLKEWFKDKRCPVKTTFCLHKRVKQWGFERAMTTPLRERNGAVRYWTYRGEKKTLREWSKDPRCKVAYSSLAQRIYGQKMKFARALTKPPQPRYGFTFTYKGKTKTVREWSKDSRCKVRLSTLRARLLRSKWDIARALITPTDIFFKPATTFTYKGKAKTVREWSRDPRCQVGVHTLRGRLFSLKWDIGRALTAPQKTTGRKRQSR